MICKIAEPGTVIRSTHRTQDLIPAFIGLLRDLQSPHYTAFITTVFPLIPSDAQDNDDHEFWESEDAHYLLEDLFDALQDHAPDDHYFGAHEGDGSDFGFWKINLS